MYDKLREDLTQAAQELDQLTPGIAQELQEPIAIYVGEDPSAITPEISRKVHHVLDYLGGFDANRCIEGIQNVTVA